MQTKQGTCADFVSLLYAKQVLMQTLYCYTVFRKRRLKFSESVDQE